jgi:hypothetical protein
MAGEDAVYYGTKLRRPKWSVPFLCLQRLRMDSLEQRLLNDIVYGRPAVECWRSPLYSGVNACSSSRAASLKSFRGSIPAPLFISSCRLRIVLFGAK